VAYVIGESRHLRAAVAFAASASLATLSWSTRAGAAGGAACPAPEAAPLGSIDAETRLRFLARVFEREVRDLDIWSWSWGTTYVAAAAAQGSIAAVTRDHGLRIDLTVGAVSAGVGALTLYGLPLQVTLPLRAAPRPANAMRAPPNVPDPELCRALAEAETTLFGAASRERLSSGWLAHAGNVLFNAGLVVVLGVGFRRWASAALSAGIGTAVGEANVLTQPHHLPDVSDRYRAGHLDEAAATDRNAAFVARGTTVGWQIRF
jgi:hypothetical protein